MLEKLPRSEFARPSIACPFGGRDGPQLEAAFRRWRGHGQYKAYVAFCELDHRSAMIKEQRGSERVIVVTAA